MNRRIRMDIAKSVLNKEIRNISTVNEWAHKMGWERSEFSRTFRKFYGRSAKDVLYEEKLEMIRLYLYDAPFSKHYVIAHDLGFRDEKALYDFIRYHCKCSTSEFIRSLHQPGLKRAG